MNFNLFNLIEEAFNEALKESPASVINICKYPEYTEFLKLYDISNTNTKNLIEFIYTYKHTENLDLITGSIRRQVHDLLKTIIAFDNPLEQQNMVLNAINRILNMDFNFKDFSICSDSLTRSLIQKYPGQLTDIVAKLLADVSYTLNADTSYISPYNFFKGLLSHLEIPIKALLPNKLSLIVDKNITNDQYVSLATTILSGNKKTQNISKKEAFEKSDIVNLIVQFVGFEKSLCPYIDLTKIIQNIQWSISDILNSPYVKNLKTVRIIDNSKTIIDAVGKFYNDTHDIKLDINSLKEMVFSYDCQNRYLTTNLLSLQDIYGTRKFEEFIYMKGLSNTLNIRIEFYSEEYGLASFGRNINNYESIIAIYQVKQNQYIMSEQSERTSLKATYIEPSNKRIAEYESDEINSKKIRVSLPEQYLKIEDEALLGVELINHLCYDEIL
jgi:hypothetical protein